MKTPMLSYMNSYIFFFYFSGLSNNQVMEHVKAGHTLTIPSGIKPQLETLLKSCWNITATKRPTASEIVELLSNNPRLISPCIDVPLASVQVERTDSLELIPSVSKNSSLMMVMYFFSVAAEIQYMKYLYYIQSKKLFSYLLRSFDEESKI